MPASREPFQGLIAAPLTPYDAKGEINPDVIAPYASLLKIAGVSGVFVNGSTGEGALLHVGERLALAEAWVAQAAQDFKVIVHLYHQTTREHRVVYGRTQDTDDYIVWPGHGTDSIAASTGQHRTGPRD